VIPEASRKRYAAGRTIRVAKTMRTTRDLIRRHLKEEKRYQSELAIPWNCKPSTAKAIMMRTGRPLSSQYIDAFVEWLKLDEFDATELHRLAAIENGFKIDGPRV